MSLVTQQPYVAVSGSAVIECDGGQRIALQPSRANRRRARSLSQLDSYHCWIRAAYEANGVATQEVIDFTVRHDALVAKEYGYRISRMLPRFIWTTIPSIGGADVHGQSAQGQFPPYQEMADLTALLRLYERDFGGLFTKLTGPALQWLAGEIEQGRATRLAERPRGCVRPRPPPFVRPRARS
ncbi:hypothetical protein N5B55_05830 [Ralstonia pickettii]|uniref:hypothetical protein n=1 Tax=Ralstonia pickettii TaxID=329 RepID=UPI002714B44E|nr:hypothetical protein [Ralstonia pickettii]WKZ86469.1 hypothetical protein N5B55_05830 [Ralstonia pickettii]